MISKSFTHLLLRKNYYKLSTPNNIARSRPSFIQCKLIASTGCKSKRVSTFSRNLSFHPFFYVGGNTLQSSKSKLYLDANPVRSRFQSQRSQTTYKVSRNFSQAVSLLSQVSSSSSPVFQPTPFTELQIDRSIERLSRMASVNVKSFDDEAILRITVDLPMSQTSDAIKSFNLNRQKTEILESTLSRFRASLSQKLKRKKVKKKKPVSEEGASSAAEAEEDIDKIAIEILHNGEPIAPSTMNKDAWIEGAVLRVGDHEITMAMNIPTVVLKNLPSMILSGFHIFVEAEFEFTDRSLCEFYWKSCDKKEMSRMQQRVSKGPLDVTDMKKGAMYLPTKEDVGRYLVAVCVPKNGDKIGKFSGVVSRSVVSEGPESCPFEKRHRSTEHLSEDGRFRVVSYNILAKVYSDTEAARTQFFRHCPPEILDMDYRKHLLMKEILGYNSDLICLQEVDKSMFEHQLVPALEMEGLQGLFLPKDGNVAEGCANFFRRSKFRIVKEANIALSNFLKADPTCADIWEEVSKLEPLKEKIMQRSSILQVTVLQEVDNPDRLVCVANTHFYFHPTACNIRLIHAAVALRHLQNVVASYRQLDKTVGLVFCGDFNSRPQLGMYQLMTCQFVPSDHFDWSSAGDTELLTSLELSHPMNMENTYGEPAYTNYTLGFKATLDYIFYDTDVLELCSNVPLPTHEEVVEHQALPNVVFPSDHLALISELKFR